jgi:preprotein translocase subunit SecG
MGHVLPFGVFFMWSKVCYNCTTFEGGNRQLAKYFNIVQIILSVAVIVLVILQSKGGSLSRMFGGEGGVYKTRRGFERTLFNITIAVMVTFFIFSLLSVMFQ